MKKSLLKNDFHLKYKLHQWMTLYYEKIKNKTLKDIPIFGSHDSGSYTCNGIYGVSPNSGFPNSLYKLSKLFCLDYKFSNWSIDQKLRINEQLNKGIN